MHLQTLKITLIIANGLCIEISSHRKLSELRTFYFIEQSQVPSERSTPSYLYSCLLRILFRIVSALT